MRIQFRNRLTRVWVLLLAFTVTIARAQTNRGGISGNITDVTGAAVPNASIVITNVGTNETRKLTSNDKGSFLQENMEPVVYRLEVEAPGFKKSVLEKVKVDTSSIVTANVVLEPGNVSTQVTVEGATSLINTESGTLGQTISSRTLTNTPLPTRSVLDMAVTIANVSGDVGSSDPQIGVASPPLPGYNLQANGGRAGSTEILADGISNTGVGLGREAVSFSPETVQEFTVETNGFDAQYGRSGGGIISVTTKSGANDFNGLALWYLRNPDTNAAPYTLASVNRPVNNLRWNQFSGQLGGPVWIPKLYDGRNKTFFFFAGEPRYQRDKQQLLSSVPTDAMRAGDFSNLIELNGQNMWVPYSLYTSGKFPATAFQPSVPNTIYNHYMVVGNQFVTAGSLPNGATYPAFPGNVIPTSMLDPVALKLLQYVPKANVPYFLDSNGVIENYVTYQYLQNDQTRYNLRLDQNFSDRNHFTFRWTSVPSIGISANDPNYPTNGNSGTYSQSKQFMISDTQIFSPTVVNELRLAYTRADFSGQLSPQYDIKSGANLSTQLGLPSLTKGGLSLFNIYDNGNSPANIGTQTSTLGYSLEQQYEIADNIYITRGGMTWKFGVDLTRAMLNDLSLYSVTGGNYQFRYLQTNSNGSTGSIASTGGNAFASFLLGVPNAITLSPSAIPYYYRWNSGAAYLQNDWKIRPNLTLNLGVRYSLQLPRTENNNYQGFLDPSQAKIYTLPKPCQLPDCNTASASTGLPVITQAVVIPFAFSGYGGRSRYLTPIHWLNFEPRFGFAYTPHLPDFLGGKAWVVRGGYGISHTPLTGQNRNPVPNFSGGAANYGETSGQTNPAYVTRLGSNPPYDPGTPANQVLGLSNNPSGLVYDQAINFGNVLIGDGTVPYVQNWSLSLQRQVSKRGVLELSYAGSKGTHLFMPSVFLNNPSSSYLSTLVNLNVKATSTATDPLGRKNSAGATLTDPYWSLASPVLGYTNLTSYWDASGNSTFHAAIVDYRWQSQHLTFYTNFRWSKSIDNASDASPDKFALSTGTVGGGQYSFGAPASIDRSVSTFNIPYLFNFVGLYDLPYGRDRRWGKNAWAPLETVLGGWSVAGVERLSSGYPFTPTIAADNFIDTQHTHEIRPNIVSGVPLVNPDWTRSCPIGNVCAPYVNYSAFELPPAGLLGNAPRTIAGLTGPMSQTLDMSIQKNFKIGEKRAIQFRVDALNVLNHPVFRLPGDVGGGTDIFGNYPSFSWTAASLQSLYQSWQAANPTLAQPMNTPTGAAQLAAFQQMILSQQNAKGTLPADYYTVPLPAHIATTNANAYNILDASGNGFKYYEIRNNLNSGTAVGGALNYNRQLDSQRYLQFGIKIIF